MRVAVIALLAAGCATGQYQTAHTLPKGDLRVTISDAYLTNESGRAIPVLPQLAVRYGFTQRLDAGASLFLSTGALLDGKYNLRSPTADLALAIRAGAGWATEFLSNGSVFHLPVSVLASYRFGALEPYAAVGYGAYWVFGRRPPNFDPDTRYAARTGTGDGNLLVSAGLEWKLGRVVSLLFDYTLLQPLLDDPGDSFSFVRNHQVGIGLGFQG